ncbi:hypothetical protein NVV31_21935 [Cytobacillus firmus]|uniref:hypothetical protein n=1 Tax=Cytobacillus firmus TaxID=1399 RepID=UPI0021C72EA1|nr:hypothetical protein [Cytobacillus firmus]MCU1808055.1 hypothetical protein [Cytobacillus firmus]
MNYLWKLAAGLWLVMALTGCIAEEYDFTPPAVTLSNTDSVQSAELKEANVDWIGENNKQIKKETDDIISFGKKQEALSYKAGQKIDLLFDSEDFLVEELSVSLWKDDEEIQLDLNDLRSFSLPEEKGEYVIEVYLRSDSGSAQYAGNVVIQ